MVYDFSTNITVTELERMLAYAKERGASCIAAHFKRGSILGEIKVSMPGPGWQDYEAHECVTDWDAA